MSGDPTTLVVARAVAGRADGVAALVERWSPWLLVEARLRLRGRLAGLCDPEDLVQDVWLRVLPRIGTLDLRGRRRTPVLAKYLTTTLARRLRDLIGRAARRRDWALPGDGRSDVLVASVTGALSRAVVRERAELLWDAVQSLPPKDQQLVLLRGIERAPYSEIAAVLGTTAPAAASAWRRARARLAQRIGETR